jgi:putative transposase
MDYGSSTMEDVAERFHRRSVRMRGFDYTQPGAYFVTIVTVQRGSLFGEVVDGEMRLNDLGTIASNEWLRTTILRPNVQLNTDEFVVMPNHVHGIIWIIDNKSDYPSRGAAKLPPNPKTKFQPHNVHPNSLGAIVRAYKSAVTYRINTLRNSHGSPIWQRNYFEHIIRNEIELNNIARYICANAANWADDPEYTL